MSIQSTPLIATNDCATRAHWGAVLIGPSLIAICLSLAAPVLVAEQAPPSLANVTHRLQDRQSLVFATFGDSITWPCYHTDFRQNYITLTVDALHKACPGANVRIVHAGNMGTAGRGLAETRYQRYVLDHDPDVVFIMFGMNDCGSGPGGLEDYDRNLTRLITDARAAGALPVVLTQNEIIYDCPDGAGRGALALYARRAVEVARREQTPYVDCFADWQPLKDDRDALIARLNDWIHPNLAGHRLFAKSIVSTLWPEAARHVEAAVRPAPRSAGTPCLVPGPAGKQVVRTECGTWFALHGRRRGERISDLVISYSRTQRPNWSDFTHTTLIGPDPDAPFADDDKDITAAHLRAQGSTLIVLFSWNTGVFSLSVDVSDPEWTTRLGTVAAWKDLQADPFVRPNSIINSELGNGLLFDSVGHPSGDVVLCRTRQKAPGAGWEVLDGEDGIATVAGSGDARQVEFLFPSFEFARCGRTNSDAFVVVAQKSQEEPAVVGGSAEYQVTLPLEGPHRLAMPLLVDGGYVIATPIEPLHAAATARQVAIVWSLSNTVRPVDFTRRELDGVAAGQEALPAVLDSRPAFVVVDRSERGGVPQVAYESLPARGATTAGALIDRGGSFEFQHLRMWFVE